MKLLEKITLIIYSIIILILSIFMCSIIFNWLPINSITNLLNNIVLYKYVKIFILFISIVFILLSLKCIFFGTRRKDQYKDNILLKNEEGKLVITKASIESLVNNIVKGFENIQEFNTKVDFDKENNIIININLLVKDNIIIKELSDNMRMKIKQVIKKTSDLEIKEINIKIKNIEKTNN